MNKSIRDLPLNPSKRHPGWRRHQRNNMQQQGGNGQQQQAMMGQRPNPQQMGGRPQGQNNGNGQGQKQSQGPKALPPLPPEIENRLIAQVNQQFKGRTLAEKCAEYRKLAEAHAKGDGTPTAIRGAGMGRPNDYLEKFREQTQSFPKTFDDLVPESIKKAGDQLLAAGEQSGFSVTGYGVGKVGEYSRFMRQGDRILYHQYSAFPEHGEELLRRLSKLGMEFPYDVSFLATSTRWKEEWGEEPEVELENVEGDKVVGRSVQFVLAFKPGSKEDAAKLVEFFERNAKGGGKQSMPHSWQIADIRSTFKEKVDEFQKNILNIKKIDDFELLLLKKQPLRGFEPYDVWLNPDLSKFVKSLAILVTLPYRVPIAIGRGVNKSFSRLRKIGNMMVPIGEAHG